MAGDVYLGIEMHGYVSNFRIVSGLKSFGFEGFRV